MGIQTTIDNIQAIINLRKAWIAVATTKTQDKKVQAQLVDLNNLLSHIVISVNNDEIEFQKLLPILQKNNIHFPASPTSVNQNDIQLLHNEITQLQAAAKTQANILINVSLIANHLAKLAANQMLPFDGTPATYHALLALSKDYIDKVSEWRDSNKYPTLPKNSKLIQESEVLLENLIIIYQGGGKIFVQNTILQELADFLTEIRKL